MFHSVNAQLSVFFAPTRYKVVKIARFSSKVVLRTTKHMVIYPGIDVFCTDKNRMIKIMHFSSEMIL
jgi:hypothetical protein